jgi:hypothetical protein
MTRDELAKLRAKLIAQVAELKRIGDYGAGSKDILANAECCLALATHLLDRMRSDRTAGRE